MSDGSIIIDTLLDTKEFKSQMGKLKGITDNAMKPVLTSIGAVTAAVTGVSASAVKLGNEYEKASNRMMAATGANMYEIENLNNVLKNVYADNFGEDMNDVADAITNVTQQIKGLNDTDLQTVTEYALGFRDAFGYDVSESVRSAKALMDNFGISAQQAYSLIAQGAQQGLDYSGELLDNIDEYSVQFGKLGLSAEDMFNIFESGANAGAFNLDKIGDAVKEFSIRAIDGSNTTIDGFTRLGLNADEMAQKFANGGNVAKNAFYEVIKRISEMDNSVEQSTVGVDLFGTMWEDLGPEVVTQLGSIQGAFDQTYDTMEDINAIQYNDLSSALQGIGREIQTNLLLPISDKLLPIFSDLANKLSDAFASGELQSSIDKIAGAIGSLVEGVAGFAEKWLPSIIDLVSWIISNAPTIISLLAGIGVGLKVFQIGNAIASFVSGFKTASTAVQGVSGAFKAFNAVLSANPIILIVSVIATLVTALITLWNTNEGFRNAVINAWNAICEFVGNIVSTIVSFFTETLPQTFQNVINWFAQLPSNIWNWLTQAINNIIQWGIQTWQQSNQAMMNFFNNVINWFAQLPGNIWNWLVETINNIIKWGVETWQKSNQAMMDFFNNIINWFKQLPGNIWTWLVQVINNVVNWVADMKSKAEQGVSNMINSIINWFKELPGKIVDIGKNIVQGLWNGITGAAGWLWDKISGFCGGIVNKIKGFFGIHSPSKLFNQEIGKFLALGLGEGFDDNLGKVYNQMKSAVDFETQKLSANLSTTATNNKMLTANITLNQGDIIMDSTKVGRVVTPVVTKTLRGAGAY